MSLPYKRKDSPYWWIAPMIDGVQDPRSSKTRDYQEALRMVRRLEGKVAEGEPIANDKILFEELAAKLVQKYRIEGRKTLVDLERRLNKHILPKIGRFRAAAIPGTDIIEDYIDARLEEGAKPGGIRIELAHIKTAYRLAARKKKGFVIPYIPTLKGKVRETRYTDAQYHALLRHSNRILRVVLQIAYWTGWRKKSILQLPWSQVDFDARFVWLEMPNTKNEKGTRCYLHDELLTLFEQLRADTDRIQKEKGMIIPWVIHREGLPVKSIRTAFENARAQAGLAGHVIHDFRRTAVRALGDSKVGAGEIQEMVGFKSLEMVVRYMGKTSDSRLQEIGEELARKRGRRTT